MRKLSLIVLIVLLLPLSVFAQGDGEEEENFIVSPDGSFAVLLPSGWVAEFDSSDAASFASSEEAFEIAGSTEADIPVLPSGEFAIEVSVFPTEFLPLLELEADVSMVEFLETFVALLQEEDDDIPELTEPEEIELVPGRTAAVSRASEGGADFVLVTYHIAPNTIGFAGIIGAEGELFASEEELLAVLDGVLYSPPLDEVYEDEALEINYLAGWEVELVEAGAYSITNVAEKLEEDADPLEDNEYIMAVYNLTALGVEDGELAELLVAVGEELLDEDEEDSFTEPVQIPLEDRELYGMTVIQADEDENGGGLLITRANTGEILVIVYATVLGQETLASWTAANILLQVDVKQ